jgi:hypothetical protein
MAVCHARRSGDLYRATIDSGGIIQFSNLPVDKYDLIFFTDTAIYEGCQLLKESDAASVTANQDLITDEVTKIEGFFNHKTIHRLEIQGVSAMVLVQQWRDKKTLTQGGAVLSGSIHSLDLIWFEKPLKGWQLTKRRQLYRKRLDKMDALSHVYLSTLGNIRVLTQVVTMDNVSLTK